MKEKWNAERKTNLVVKFVPSTRGKNCAIFICPYRETAVATIPAIDLNPREQIKQISTPQIITKVHNLARLRRLTVSLKNKKIKKKDKPLSGCVRGKM